MTDIKTVLKPCPLCGCEARLCSNQVAEDEMHTYVVCNGCDLKTGGIEAPYSEPEYAIAEWNTRAAPVDAQDAVDAKRLQISIMELEFERKKSQHFLDMLVSISSLTVGPDVTVGDKTYRFNPPNAAEILHELSARIRAIPEKIAALQASQSPQDQVKEKE